MGYVRYNKGLILLSSQDINCFNENIESKLALLLIKYIECYR